jgi:hypothetical protein
MKNSRSFINLLTHQFEEEIIQGVSKRALELLKAYVDLFRGYIVFCHNAAKYTEFYLG